MEQFWQGMIFSTNIILPLVGLIWAGRYLRTTGQIREQFLADVNGLLYRYGIPGLLFFSILKSQENILSQWRLIAAGYLATYVLYLGSTLLANRYIKNPADKGVFVQGVFRGNLAILGMAFVLQTYGEYGREIGGILAGAVALELNILSILCFDKSTQDKEIKTPLLSRYRSITVKMTKNPLVIGILSAFLLKFLAVPLPKILFDFGELFTRLTLPLSLLSIGAVFNLRGIFGAEKMAIFASIGRLFISPLCFLLAGLLFGVSGKALAILCLMGAVPAANAGYIMAKSLGGNAIAAANIIAITTAAAPLVVAPLIAIFYALGWV